MIKRTLASFLLIFSLISFSNSAHAEILTFYEAGGSLRVGMANDYVFFLQIYLADQGLFPRNRITGYFGPLTERAVKLFQSAHGIESVGIVGPKTKAKISQLVASSRFNISNGSDHHLPPPLLVATSTEVGSIVHTISTSSTERTIEEAPAYDLERMAKQIQNLINDRRSSSGLGPIYWDEELALVAKEHSTDQAGDNNKVTDQSIPCHYPIIRHEGFTMTGYTLRERYESRNIEFRYGGENIAMIPASKDLLYLHPSNEPLIKCRDVDKFEPGVGTKEERTKLFRSILDASLEAVRDLKSVNWVGRHWRSEGELAEMAVEGWMNSPGHRENILRRDYTVGGIGIVMVNDYMIITHNFVGR